MWCIDERDGEICRFVRERRNKLQAVDTAALVYGVPYEKVMQLLQREGLLDEQGNYIEPIRLTGKEHTMGRKKPDYYWSPKRKQLLQEMYQAGQEAPAIADQLGTTTVIVYDAIAKFNIARTRTVDPVADPPEAPPADPAVVDTPPATAPLVGEWELQELSHLVDRAHAMATETPNLFLRDLYYEAFMELGKMDIILHNAQQLLRKLFPDHLPPTPEP